MHTTKKVWATEMQENLKKSSKDITNIYKRPIPINICMKLKDKK